MLKRVKWKTGGQCDPLQEEVWLREEEAGPSEGSEEDVSLDEIASTAQIWEAQNYEEELQRICREEVARIEEEEMRPEPHQREYHYEVRNGLLYQVKQRWKEKKWLG